MVLGHEQRNEKREGNKRLFLPGEWSVQGKILKQDWSLIRCGTYQCLLSHTKLNAPQAALHRPLPTTVGFQTDLSCCLNAASNIIYCICLYKTAICSFQRIHFIPQCQEETICFKSLLMSDDQHPFAWHQCLSCSKRIHVNPKISLINRLPCVNNMRWNY